MGRKPKPSLVEVACHIANQYKKELEELKEELLREIELWKNDFHTTDTLIIALEILAEKRERPEGWREKEAQNERM